MCEHSLPLVISERDPLCRHLEVDDGGRWWGVHGERQRGRLLHRLMSRQRLQRHRAQVPHVTRCTVTQTHTQNKGKVHHKMKIKVIVTTSPSFSPYTGPDPLLCCQTVLVTMCLLPLPSSLYILYSTNYYLEPEP